MSDARKLRILACQIAVPITREAAARDRHLERIYELVRAALNRQPADLAVLPELSSIEYSREAFGCLGSLAETLEGPSFHMFSSLARETRTPILYGIPRVDGDRYLISQVAVGAGGDYLGHFDKLHMAHYGASLEKSYFSRGNQLLVLDLSGVRIAPIICYDIRFPELARTLALRHGAQLLLHCSAYYTDESYYSWHPFVVTRALENQVPILSLNRAGPSFGSSIYCPPWVDDTRPEIVFPNEEICRIIEVDPELSRAARERYPFLEDRIGEASEYDALPAVTVR